MERVYQRKNVRQVYTGASRERERTAADKPLFSLKKLAIQSAVCIIVFAVAYMSGFYDNSFCKAVKNEVLYTLNYSVNIENVYKSSQEVFRYLSGTLEQGKIYVNSVIPDTQPASAQTGNASDEAYGPIAQ